jgi:toxin FitB
VYTLDTNTIIYYMENDPAVALLVQSILDDPAVPVYVLTITEAELFSHKNLSAEEEKIIDDILQAVSLVAPISKIARAAGRIRGAYGLKLGDSLIAATALYTGSTLLTRNVRDFRKIPHLSLQAI